MDPVIKGTPAAAEHTESGERNHWPTNSIFRAPAHIRSGRKSYFEPKLVSIGPYYHGRKDLKHMEDLKLWCIPEIPAKQAAGVRNPPRSGNVGILRWRRSIYNVPVEPSMKDPPRGLDDVPVEPFKNLGGIARAYYPQEFDQISPDNFVRMLVLDSCFIIRIILALFQPVQESMAFLDVHIKEVRSDLLLLENQIPLFFIREVYKRLFPCMFEQNFPHFNTILQPFICLDMPWRINDHGMSSEAVHLLDLYWRCSLSPKMYTKLSELERDLLEEGETSWAEMHVSINATMLIANAKELHKTAGIIFKKFEDKGHLDVIFSYPFMKMPFLKIDSRQKTLLVNLIAFESSILPTMRTFSSYMKLMAALIDSKRDVKLLQKCGVIDNTLGSHEMAATFFNDIGKFCFVGSNENHFPGLYKDVQKHYDSRWSRISGSLRQTYFSDPWSGISFMTNANLLVYGGIQTIFTVLAYLVSKK